MYLRRRKNLLSMAQHWACIKTFINLENLVSLHLFQECFIFIAVITEWCHGHHTEVASENAQMLLFTSYYLPSGSQVHAWLVKHVMFDFYSRRLCSPGLYVFTIRHVISKMFTFWELNTNVMPKALGQKKWKLLRGKWVDLQLHFRAVAKKVMKNQSLCCCIAQLVEFLKFIATFQGFLAFTVLLCWLRGDLNTDENTPP